MSDIGFPGFQNFGYFFNFPKFENGMKDWGQNSMGAARMPLPILMEKARADRRSSTITGGSCLDNQYVMNWPALMARRLEGMMVRAVGGVWERSHEVSTTTR